MAGRSPRLSRSFDRGAARIASIYFIVSIAWIFGSDWLALVLAGGNTRVFHLLENAKGVVFVTLTGLGLYLLVAVANARERKEAEERRLMEGMLAVARRLEALGTLAGTIAHDFNNIVAVIRGAANLVKLENYDAGNIRARIDEIERSAEQAGQLVQQLMLFMQNAPTSFAETDVARELAENLPLLQQAASRSVEVALRLEGDLPRVQLVSSQFHVALLNLVLNARDAVENAADKLIAIEARRRELRGYRSVFQPEPVSGTFVAVSVCDAGCGIPRSEMAQVFGPFYTTKPEGKGTGLGLTSVLKIMQTHHGWVEVESEVGKGSRFTLYLPAVTPPTAPGGPVRGATAAG